MLLDEDIVYSRRLIGVKVLRKQGCNRYAKTLYKPERPDYEKELITSFTKDALPHFFVYAKDKKLHQVSDINNSLVNKLNEFIPNPKITLTRPNIPTMNPGVGEITVRLVRRLLEK